MTAQTVPTLSSISKPCRNSSLFSSTRISNWTTRYAFSETNCKQLYQCDPHQFSYEADRQLDSFAEAALMLEVMQDGQPRSSPSLSCSSDITRSYQQNERETAQIFLRKPDIWPRFLASWIPRGRFRPRSCGCCSLEWPPSPIWHQRSQRYLHNRYTSGAKLCESHLSKPPSQSYVFLKLAFQPCDGYTALATKQLPAILLNTTGILRQNVDTLVQAMYQPFGSFGKCNISFPGGPAGT